MNPAKIITAVFLALAIIVSSAWMQPEAQDTLVRLYRTMWAAKRSNVRMGPGTEHRKVGLLEVGRKVQVTGKVGDWYRIRKGGGHAFVYGPLLSDSPQGSGVRQAAVPRRQTRSPSPGRTAKKMWAAYRSALRMGPGKQHREVGILELGSEVQVTGKVGDWYRIRRGSGHAFVYSRLLSASPPSAATRREVARRRAIAPRRQARSSRQGRQVISYNNGRYEGQVRNGQRHGQGTYTWTDGDRYKGQWRNGSRTGRGVYRWSNGDRYEGDFVDGEITGRGIRTWTDGRRHEGGWHDGKKHGQGTSTWANGNRYKGQWRHGKQHGRGTFTWANGNRYRGDWKSGKRTGRGIFTWPEGDRYEGDFVDGKRHGHGTYSYASGSRYQGEWRNGERTGWGTHVSANGRVKEGEWKDNKLVRRSARMQRQQRNERQLQEAKRQRQRAEREKQQRRETNTSLALGILDGIARGLGGRGGSLSPEAMAMAMRSTGGGGQCESIGQRLARDLETVERHQSGGTCSMARDMARAYRRARNDLASSSCATREALAEMDRMISGANATARAACEPN